MDPARVTFGLELFIGDRTSRPPLRHRWFVASLADGLPEPAHREIGRPMRDCRFQPVPGWLWDLVEDLHLLLAVGLPVLVRCERGLNRSCMVAGLALREFGWSGAHAVQTIRDARGPVALSNPYFRDLVLAWPRDPMVRERA